MLLGSSTGARSGGSPGRLARWAPAWQQPLERLLGGDAPEPSLIEWDEWDENDPASFYLPAHSAQDPDSSYEGRADAFAVVQGSRLPLHSQVLAARSAVLRGALLWQAPGAAGDSSQAYTGLTSAFAGHSLAQVTCFLRLLYSPDQATPATLAALHAAAAGGGLLRAVVHLAHRLDVPGLLTKCERYLQGAVAEAEVPELLPWLEVAEQCHLAALHDTCLQQLARRLAAAGPFVHEQVSQEQLSAHCSSETLATLACSMASMVHAGGLQPEVVFDVRPGLAFSTGGFTWVLQHFSKRSGRVCSPWVKVGGLEWRLKLWPMGDDAAGGTHLSGYLEVNWAQVQTAGLRMVAANYKFTCVDQSDIACHYIADCGQDTFTAATSNWGKTRLVPHSELLHRTDRWYIKDDRLVVRIDIQVRLPPGAGPSSAAAFHALQAQQQEG